MKGRRVHEFDGQLWVIHCQKKTKNLQLYFVDTTHESRSKRQLHRMQFLSANLVMRTFLNTTFQAALSGGLYVGLTTFG
jgi:hypothetical protein